MKLSLAALLLSGGAAAQSSLMKEGSGFKAIIQMETDATLDGNTNIVGVHLHTGSDTVNGPITIIYCMGTPLPAGDWPTCSALISSTTTSNGVFKGNFLAKESYGAWAPGVNNATSIPNATTLADGAPTTFDTFMQALEECTEFECDVYFNWHTTYSYSMNPGFGLSRAQLSPLASCPSHVSGSAKCYGTKGKVSSDNTNKVTGITQPLPSNAGTAKVLIVVPDNSNSAVTISADSNSAVTLSIPDEDGDNSAAASTTTAWSRHFFFALVSVGGAYWAFLV